MDIFTAVIEADNGITHGILALETFKTRKAAVSCLKKIFTLNHRGDAKLFSKARMGKKDCWRMAGEWPEKFTQRDDIIKSLEKMQNTYSSRTMNTVYCVFKSSLND